MTCQGKTSTDIHMALDIVDFLQHETHFDEFIVFSADADFTPVLRRLRRFDRRTSLLAVGPSSSAYQASADLIIDERLFVDQALGLGRAPAAGSNDTESAACSTSKRTPLPPPPTSPTIPVPKPITIEEHTQIIAVIEAVLAKSPSPVAAATVASTLRARFPVPLQSWGNCTSFKAFFQSLGLTHLVWIPDDAGQIADPAQHAIGGQQRAGTPDFLMWRGSEKLMPLAQDVCRRTGAPFLAPHVIRKVIEAICHDVAQFPFELDGTAGRVAEFCQASAGRCDVTAYQVGFILRGMQLNGHAFFRGRDHAVTLAQRLSSQIIFLCQRRQMVLDESKKLQIRRWIGGDLFVEIPSNAVSDKNRYCFESSDICEVA